MSLKNKQTKIISAGEPRFWLKHDLIWTSLQKNVGSIKKEDLPNHESPTSFFTDLISNAYLLYEEDQEQYVDETLTQDMKEKQKKSFGIHDNPHIVDEDTVNDDRMDEVASNSERMDNDASNTAGVKDDASGVDSDLSFNGDQSFEDNDPYELPAQIQEGSTEVAAVAEEITPTVNIDRVADELMERNDDDSEAIFPEIMKAMVPKIELKEDVGVVEV